MMDGWRLEAKSYVPQTYNEAILKRSAPLTYHYSDTP
jgi:hypothetical protein